MAQSETGKQVENLLAMSNDGRTYMKKDLLRFSRSPTGQLNSRLSPKLTPQDVDRSHCNLTC